MGFWDDLKSAFGGGGGDTKTTTDTSKGGRGSEAEQFPKNTAVDDLLMDLGLKEKNVAYHRDLEERQERSRSLLTQSQDDNDKPAPAPEPEPEAEPKVAAEPTVPDIVTEVPQPPAPRVVYVGGGGGSTRQPAKPDPVYKGRRIVPPSGRTEASAMEAGQRGRKSTIKTAPTGLLDQPELRRRSLMGGLIS